MKLVEFSFNETPISVQAKNKTRKRNYMNRINSLASEIVSSGFPIISDELFAKITYFHQGTTSLDIDNIIKPILDSLVGVFYIDDALIGEVNCKRIDLNGTYNIINTTPLLVSQLTKGREFVYFELFEYNSTFKYV